VKARRAMFQDVSTRPVIVFDPGPVHVGNSGGQDASGSIFSEYFCCTLSVQFQKYSTLILILLALL